MHENALTAGTRAAGAGRLRQTVKSFVALWTVPCGETLTKLKQECMKRSGFEEDSPRGNVKDSTGNLEVRGTESSDTNPGERGGFLGNRGRIRKLWSQRQSPLGLGNCLDMWSNGEGRTEGQTWVTDKQVCFNQIRNPREYTDFTGRY